MNDHTDNPTIDDMRERILTAAASCFARFGVRKTSMVDIAHHAKIGRQSLYRRFASKEAVIEAVLIDRVSRSLDAMRESFGRTLDLEDQIVEAFLGTLRIVEADAALESIVVDAEDHATNMLLISPASPLHLVATDLWGPILRAARNAERLRKDLSEDEAIQYIRGFHYIMQLRTDIDDNRKLMFARSVLLPTLLVDAGNKYAEISQLPPSV